MNSSGTSELTTRYQQASSAWRAGFATLLAVAMTVSTFNVPIYSVLSRFIIDDLVISRSQFGWLVTLVTASAAAGSPITGRLADRFGGRRMTLGIFGLGLLTVVIIASAPTFQLMLVASAIAGLANAAGNPGTNKLIATRMASGERGLVMGIKQSGVQLGVLIGGLTLPPLAVTFGWRTAVLAVAVVPLAGAVAAWSLLDRDVPIPEDRTPSHEFRHKPGTRWIAGYAFVMGMGTAAVVSFVPLFAQEAVGTSVTVAGLAASAIGFSGVIARIVWGVVSEEQDHFAGPMAALGALAMAATAAIWASADRGVWLLWVGVLLAGASVSAWNAVANLAAVADVSSRDAGRASGLVLGSFLAGFTLSPVAFGYSVDVTGSYDLGWSAVIVVFALGTLAALSWRWYERRALTTPS